MLSAIPHCSARERVLDFHQMSPDDVDHLRKMCRKIIIHPNLADEACSHALAAAFEHYDGRVPKEHYILKVARNYAIDQSRCHDGGHADQFSDIESRNPDWSRVELVPDATDYFSEAEKEETAQLPWVKQALLVLKDEATDPRLSKGTRLKAERARLILFGLLQDQFEESSRAQLVGTMARSLSVCEGGSLSPQSTESAMTYLRNKVFQCLPDHLRPAFKPNSLANHRSFRRMLGNHVSNR